MNANKTKFFKSNVNMKNENKKKKEKFVYFILKS